jgi:intein-encoded DNA endonuclease-like protein
MKIKKQKRKIPVNENFFNEWSPQMAYVLGYFLADGSLVINPRGSHYLDFHVTDGKLLKRIKNVLDSRHKIRERKQAGNYKNTFRMQIGSKKMFYSLNKLGIQQRKTGKEEMPRIPKKYFSDFLRGYFDGDGNIWMGYTHKKDRKNPVLALSLTLTCKNQKFLIDVEKLLRKYLNCKGSIRYASKAYRLSFSTVPALKIYHFMYNNIQDALFLFRKKSVFERFLKLKGA